MTLLNILIEPQRARVVVDSLTHDGHRRLLKRHDGTPLTATKLIALSNLGTLLAVSGRLVLLPELHCRIQSVCPRDFDDLLLHMPDLLAHLGRTLSTERGTPYRGDVIHLVGYSGQSRRMLAVTFETVNGFVTFETSRVDDGPLKGILQPPVERLGKFPESDAQLLNLARDQIAQAEEKFFGGPLFVAEVSRDGVDIRRVGDLGVPEGPSAEVAQAVHGTVVQRMLSTWTAATDPGILDPNGGIEIRYGLSTLPDSQWTSIFVDGHVTQAYLPNVQFDKIYLVKARGFNALATGNWSAPVLHKVVGKSIAVDTGGIVPNAATTIYFTNPATTYDISTAGSTNPLGPLSVPLDGSEAGVIVTCEVTFKYVTSTSGGRSMDGAVAVYLDGADYGTRSVLIDTDVTTTVLSISRTETVSYHFTGLSAGTHTFGLDFILNSQAGFGLISDMVREVKVRVERIKR